MSTNSAIHNPRAFVTPSQRGEAEARAKRLAKIAALAIPDTPIVLRPPVEVAAPEAKVAPDQPFDNWAERQHEIHQPAPKQNWFYIVGEISEDGKRTIPTIREIQLAVCARYNIELRHILSEMRTARIVRPRHVAMYLAKKLTPHSFPEIGRRFGGKDHTTVLHALRKIETIVATDTQVAGVVASICADLGCEVA